MMLESSYTYRDFYRLVHFISGNASLLHYSSVIPHITYLSFTQYLNVPESLYFGDSCRCLYVSEWWRNSNIKGQSHRERKCKNIFLHNNKWIDLRQTKTKMISGLFYSSSAKTCLFTTFVCLSHVLC